MRFATSLVLLIAAGALAAPAPFVKPSPRVPSPAEDMKKMLGKWHRVSCTGGAIPPVPRPLNDHVTFAENKITYGDGSGAVWKLTLGVDNGKKTWDINNGSTTWLGLYEMDAETLRVCFTNSPTRPPNIVPQRTGDHLQTFKRKLP